jgi:hypothetical protein
MSNNDRPEDSVYTPPEVRKEGPVTVANGFVDQTIGAKSAQGRYVEMQSAPRFPIKLPVSVKSETGDCAAETQNISANGVLFEMESDMPVGAVVDFTISVPSEILGEQVQVQIDCHGRVVRSYEDHGRRGVGVVIDEYHFERTESSEGI